MPTEPPPSVLLLYFMAAVSQEILQRKCFDGIFRRAFPRVSLPSVLQHERSIHRAMRLRSSPSPRGLGTGIRCFRWLLLLALAEAGCSEKPSVTAPVSP